MAYLIISGSHVQQEGTFALVSAEASRAFHEYSEAIQNNFLKVALWTGMLKGLSVPPPSFELSLRNIGGPMGNYHHFMKSQCGCLISQSIVDLIEELEPGVHNYFPVEIVPDEGHPPPPFRYFVLNVCQILKALDVKRGISDGELHRRDLPEERWPHILSKYHITIKSLHFQKLSEVKI